MGGCSDVRASAAAAAAAADAAAAAAAADAVAATVIGATGTEGGEKDGAPRKGLCVCVCVWKVYECLQEGKVWSCIGPALIDKMKQLAPPWLAQGIDSPSATTTEICPMQHHVLNTLDVLLSGVWVQALREWRDVGSIREADLCISRVGGDKVTPPELALPTVVSCRLAHGVCTHSCWSV